MAAHSDQWQFHGNWSTHLNMKMNNLPFSVYIEMLDLKKKTSPSVWTFETFSMLFKNWKPYILSYWTPSCLNCDLCDRMISCTFSHMSETAKIILPHPPFRKITVYYLFLMINIPLQKSKIRFWLTCITLTKPTQRRMPDNVNMHLYCTPYHQLLSTRHFFSFQSFVRSWPIWLVCLHYIAFSNIIPEVMQHQRTSVNTVMTFGMIFVVGLVKKNKNKAIPPLELPGPWKEQSKEMVRR